MSKKKVNPIELAAYALGAVVIGLVIWTVSTNLLQAVGIALGFLAVAAIGVWFRTRARQS